MFNNAAALYRSYLEVFVDDRAERVGILLSPAHGFSSSVVLVLICTVPVFGFGEVRIVTYIELVKLTSLKSSRPFFTLQLLYG